MLFCSFLVWPAGKLQASGLLPPTNLIIKDVSENSNYSVELSWTASKSPEIDGYKVYRKVGAGSFMFVYSVDKLSTVYADNVLQPNTEYSYMLKAFKGQDLSVDSKKTMIVIAPENAKPVPVKLYDTLNSLGIYNIFALLLVLLVIAYLLVSVKKRKRQARE